MPSGITFDTDSYSIKPEFRTTLDNIASTLGSYNQTYVDVYGHTDSTGADAYNMTLSRNRAESVAGYLSTHGVARARIGTQGFGRSEEHTSELQSLRRTSYAVLCLKKKKTDNVKTNNYLKKNQTYKTKKT